MSFKITKNETENKTITITTATKASPAMPIIIKFMISFGKVTKKYMLVLYSITRFIQRMFVYIRQKIIDLSSYLTNTLFYTIL